MICKISVFLLLLSVCVFVDGKNFVNDDEQLELANDQARMFLRAMTGDEDDDSLDKREFGTNCVPCKFKLNPCCAPNMCIKKFFWNECMEVKTHKPGK